MADITMYGRRGGDGWEWYTEAVRDAAIEHIERVGLPSPLDGALVDVFLAEAVSAGLTVKVKMFP